MFTHLYFFIAGLAQMWIIFSHENLKSKNNGRIEISLMDKAGKSKIYLLCQINKVNLLR